MEDTCKTIKTAKPLSTNVSIPISFLGYMFFSTSSIFAIVSSVGKQYVVALNPSLCLNLIPPRLTAASETFDTTAHPQFVVHRVAMSKPLLTRASARSFGYQVPQMADIESMTFGDAE